MPSWTEKPHVVPTINVNLAKCERHHLPLHRDDSRYHVLPGTGNLGLCEAPPVLIPCPLPCSVTFTVRLGECAGRCTGMLWQNPPVHGAACPGRPIRVACSISGKTWEESEVTDAERDDAALESLPPRAEDAVLLAACRALWGFIKSLVLGHSLTDCPEAIQNMRAQRDAVYARIAQKVQAEQADDAATLALIKELPVLTMRSVIESTAGDYLSGRALAAYVGHLVEQVGVLQ